MIGANLFNIVVIFTNKKKPTLIKNLTVKWLKSTQVETKCFTIGCNLKSSLSIRANMDFYKKNNRKRAYSITPIYSCLTACFAKPLFHRKFCFASCLLLKLSSVPRGMATWQWRWRLHGLTLMHEGGSRLAKRRYVDLLNSVCWDLRFLKDLNDVIYYSLM